MIPAVYRPIYHSAGAPTASPYAVAEPRPAGVQGFDPRSVPYFSLLLFALPGIVIGGYLGAKLTKKPWVGAVAGGLAGGAATAPFMLGGG